MRALGANARKVYEQKYSPAANFRQLAKIYEAASREAGRTVPAIADQPE
jgi:hypothetical protein